MEMRAFNPFKMQHEPFPILAQAMLFELIVFAFGFTMFIITYEPIWIIGVFILSAAIMLPAVFRFMRASKGY